MAVIVSTLAIFEDRDPEILAALNAAGATSVAEAARAFGGGKILRVEGVTEQAARSALSAIPHGNVWDATPGVDDEPGATVYVSEGTCWHDASGNLQSVLRELVPSESPQSDGCVEIIHALRFECADAQVFDDLAGEAEELLGPLGYLIVWVPGAEA